MKKLMTYLFAGLLAAGLSGCATTGGSAADAFSDEQSLASYATVVLTVHGLSCPLCASNVERPLRRLDGVRDLTVDLKTGEVAVQLTPGHSVTRSQLLKAVTESGFTLKAIAPLEEAK